MVYTLAGPVHNVPCLPPNDKAEIFKTLAHHRAKARVPSI